MDKLTNLDPHWLTGFITGDGSFSASSRNNKRNAFRVRFYLTQHSRDLELLKVIQNYFSGIGSICKNGSGFNYEVGSYKDCYTHLLPFFLKYPIPYTAIKSYNFKIWKEIIEIMMQKNIKLNPKWCSTNQWFVIKTE